MAKPGLPREELDSTEAKPRGQREVWLEAGRHEIPIYDRDALTRAPVRGPALVEAADTTFLIPGRLRVPGPSLGQRDHHRGMTR